jgi:peptidoglycan/LPS O-acetylase OafA/YrhL
MNKATSIYLDAVRFTAACSVFMSHIGVVTEKFLWQLRPLGTEAVDVFFVLSGFVISHAHSRGEQSPRIYALNRVSRLYSVALPALLIVPMIDAIGGAMRPDIYGYWANRDPHNIVHFFTSITFFNEVWNLHHVWGTNEPYWSLGFEAWYYVVFGLFIFVHDTRLKWLSAGMALVIAGPKIALLFPLWLLGVACHRQSLRKSVGQTAGGWLFWGSLVLLMAYSLMRLPSAQTFTPLTLRPDRLLPVVQHYGIGLLFAANLIGFQALTGIFLPIIERVARPIRWLAGATLTMYLLHMPVMHLVAALTPWPPSSVAARATLIAAVPLLVILLAEITERRKAFWRTILRPLFLPKAPAGPPEAPTPARLGERAA